ncbi:signal peptidase I [Acidaminobacterium chupaoyuni]
MEHNSSNMEPNEEIEKAAQPEDDKPNAKKNTAVSELFDWAEALVFALAILVTVFAFVVRLSGVDGESMYPTLYNGDQLLVASAGYTQPKRGDVVVLMADSFMAQPLVKRVIAVGGDTVTVNGESGEITVNGKTLYEPYINETTAFMGDREYPLVVPKNEVFVMGDNRNRSSDSRLSEVGTIPYEKIVGKVVFRLFPFSRIGGIQ